MDLWERERREPRVVSGLTVATRGGGHAGQAPGSPGYFLMKSSCSKWPFTMGAASTPSHCSSMVE